MYINGVAESSAARPFTNTASNQITRISGNMYDANYRFTGYLSDVRITKGRSLWSANFTPPTRSGSF